MLSETREEGRTAQITEPSRRAANVPGRPGGRGRQGARSLLPWRSKTAVLVFLLPPLALYLLAVGAPIAESFFLSFFNWNGISSLQFAGLQNYTHMFTADPTFRTAALNSAIYLFIGLLFQVGLALVLANALTYIRRGREVIKVLYLLPALLSTVAISLLFQRIYSHQPVGLLNQILSWTGLGNLSRPWLSDVHTALVAVSIPEGWRFMGIYTIILLAGLLTVPREIEEAARLDGASELKVFLKIRLPHLRPVWITTLIMATTYGLRGFDIPYLLTNGGPGVSTQLLTTYMYQNAFTSTNYGYASAISVVIVAECIAAVGAILILMRRRKESLG